MWFQLTTNPTHLFRLIRLDLVHLIPRSLSGATGTQALCRLIHLRFHLQGWLVFSLKEDPPKSLTNILHSPSFGANSAKNMKLMKTPLQLWCPSYLTRRSRNNSWLARLWFESFGTQRFYKVLLLDSWDSYIILRIWKTTIHQTHDRLHWSSWKRLEKSCFWSLKMRFGISWRAIGEWTCFSISSSMLSTIQEGSLKIGDAYPRQSGSKHFLSTQKAERTASLIPVWRISVVPAKHSGWKCKLAAWISCDNPENTRYQHSTMTSKILVELCTQ